MTGPAAAQSAQASAQPAGQQARPVVSIFCKDDLGLCRALIQALAETAPAHVYRINPSPNPPQAFDLRIEANGQDQAQLSWSGGAQKVTRTGLSDAQVSRALLHASPDLLRALQAHQSL